MTNRNANNRLEQSREKNEQPSPQDNDQPNLAAREAVDEAAIESFPASDPPAFTGAAGSPSQKSPPKIDTPPMKSKDG